MPTIRLDDLYRPLRVDDLKRTIHVDDIARPVQLSESASLTYPAMGVPTWAQGLDFFADFETSRGYDGAVKPVSFMFTDTHADPILVLDSTGRWVSHATNVFCDGQVVPTSTNLNTKLKAGLWTVLLNASKTTHVGGPYLGIFDSPQIVTDTSGGTSSRIRTDPSIPVTSGQTYAFSFWYKTGSSGKVGLYCSGNSGTSSIRMDVNGENAVYSNSRGPMTISSVAQVGTDIYRANILWVPDFTSSGGEAGIGPGSAIIGDTVIALGIQAEAGPLSTPPIITTGAVVTRTGNVLKTSLSVAAQSGVAGFVKVDQIGFNPLTLPVLLGLNPATKVAQSLMDAAVDLGTIAPALRTVVFAASPGYAKVRILGGADVASVAGDFEDDIVSLSLGGNGFDALNNLYARYKKVGLKYGAQNDTTFNTMYGMAS